MSVKKRSLKKKKVSKFNAKKSSYISLLYGIATVIVLFSIIFFGFKFFSAKLNSGITNEAVKTVKQVDKASKENIYTVKEGDNLWSIAEKSYNDGFSYIKIAQANNISDPNLIEPGTKIKIPTVQTSSSNVSTSNIENKSPSNNEIASGSYTVQKGDDLWDIAVRAYGDGFKWGEIARANNLKNPSIIHTGNVLKIPRG